MWTVYQRLRENPPKKSREHTIAVRSIKEAVKVLPCLNIVNPEAFSIVVTDALDVGYGGFLNIKFKIRNNWFNIILEMDWCAKELFYNQRKKKLLCITKLQDDIINKIFLVKIDCKTSKDVKNLRMCLIVNFSPKFLLLVPVISS